MLPKSPWWPHNPARFRHKDAATSITLHVCHVVHQALVGPGCKRVGQGQRPLKWGAADAEVQNPIDDLDQKVHITSEQIPSDTQCAQPPRAKPGEISTLRRPERRDRRCSSASGVLQGGGITCIPAWFALACILKAGLRCRKAAAHISDSSRQVDS
jgi:hypothetical protein